jgi:two-component system OmpR family sensor kinase
MRLRWLLPPVPAIAGLATTLLTSTDRLSNPILYLRADLGMASLLTGLLLSALLFTGLLLVLRAEGVVQRSVTQLQVQSAEDRRRFLRRLDHELKNPLTAIRAALANVSNDSSTAALEATEGTVLPLASVETQVLRLSRLTADLRKLAELETRPLERTHIDIGELLEETVALAQEQPEADSRHLTLILPQAPWPVPAILGDWDLILLAVYNLLSNALKFSGPGDTVEVRALEDGAGVVIEVADTGPGIAAEELPHVWEELYRGQGARGIPGSGLGLALVRAIVDRHGGQVTVRSRVGEGTVVTMRMPLQ